MATISTPLGYKIIGQNALSDTGIPIDDRQVFSSESIRTNYTPNFFYRGLLSYTVSAPYHVSGITTNSGYYTRYYDGASYSWQGLVADAVDDKHAFGTLSSSSNNTTDPTSSTNIVDHINYLYTLTKSFSSSRSWKDPVATYSDLATTYPTPEVNWAAVVNADNHIYVYNGTTWVDTGSNNVSLLNSTTDGIVDKAWYNTLNSFITTPSNYLNNNNLSNLIIKNSGSTVVGSPVESDQVSDSFTFDFTNGVTASVSGKTITVIGSTGLPDQTGNDGKFLQTNAGTASWETPVFEPVLTTGLTSQYYRGDKTWVDLTTEVVPEILSNPSRKYFTEARVLNTTLGGLVTIVAGSINASDNVLSAFGKLQYQLDNLNIPSNISVASPANGLSITNGVLSIVLSSTSNTGALSNTDWNTFNNKQNNIDTGTSTQYYRGDKTWQTLNTTAVVESGTNLYLTEGRFNTYFYTKSGVAGGFAPLETVGNALKINSIYLPSYVDQIVEAADFASLPNPGSTGIIYVTLDNNKQYRWSGSAYVEISPSPVNSVNGQTGIVTLTTNEITEGTDLYFTESRVLATQISTVGVETGEVLVGDSIELAITKLNNKQSLVSLNNDLLFFDQNSTKYTNYSQEYEGVFYKDSTRTIPTTVVSNSNYLKYSGGFATSEINATSIRISNTWKFEMSEDGNSLYLKHNPSGDGVTWVIVTRFEAVV